MPAFPMTKTECLTCVISSSCTIFSTKWSSGCRPRSWRQDGETSQLKHCTVSSHFSWLYTITVGYTAPAGWYILTTMDFLTASSNSRSLLRGTLRAGNRSPMSPMMMGTSSVTILGRLKSRTARLSTCLRTHRAK